jgi:20S proteasome alpha/beta subunit
MYMHAHTLYGGYRPFGVSVLLVSYENDEPKFYTIEPSGVSYVTKDSFYIEKN